MGYNTLTRKTSIIVIGIFFLTLGVGLWARSQAKRWPTGDEPNYAIMAQQLVSHGNLNLKQAFTEKKYIGVFYGWEVEPQVNWSYFSRAGTRWYSLHSMGEAILVAPAIIAARIARVTPLVSSIILNSLLGAVTAVMLWILCYELTRSRSGSAIATLTLILSVSFLSLTGTMFPDLPTAALLILSVIGLNRLRSSQSIANYILCSMSAVLLVVFHAKNTLICLTILALIATSLFYNGVKPKKVMLSMLPAMMLSAAYLLKIHDWYGTWIVTQPFSNGQLFILPFGWSILASLFDTTKGLLFNNPAMFLLFAGIPMWYKTDKSSLYMALLLIVPSIFIQSTFNDWAGGYSPIGRYALAYVVILLPSIAYLWQAVRHHILDQAAIVAVLLLQAAAGILYIARGYMWNYAGEQNPVLANIQSHFHLNHDISSPIFSYTTVVTSPARGMLLVLEMLVAASLFVWGTTLARRSAD